MATSSDSNMQDDEQEISTTESSSLFPGFSDVNEFSQKTLRAVLMATRSSNDLPVGEDFDFYSTYRSVRDVLDFEGQRILSLLQRLLRQQNVKGNIHHHQQTLELEDQFDILMDANDQILERAGTLLDEASGIRKEETKLVIVTGSTPAHDKAESWNKPAAKTSKPEVAYKLMTARNIQRPQLRFRDKIDNTRRPFRPFLRHKPHAIKSLEDSLKLPDGVSLEEAERSDFIHPHPYLTELQAFTPGPELLQKVTPQKPQPVSLTPCIFVDTVKELQAMLDDLKAQQEIAVDLEHHSYRSFQGLTCLMQISTRARDYIIDTLELRSEIINLNEVFTNPNIIKVFHGADSDIAWLQRDFSVYVVNMFDTGQAARLLGLARFSLAYLMLTYCQMEVDKQYQLADWRIRPLPPELVNYAREDTHYLLYIYDLMRNQLVERGNEQNNLLLSVFDRSSTLAAKVYQKPSFSDSDYLDLYRKSKKLYNNQQMTAFRDIFSWRDHVARVEDESLGYVLPNHMLLQIAEILPRERQGVLACCNPIPPLVRQNLIELHELVVQARDVAMTKIEKTPMLLPSDMQHPKYDAESLLSCPHDQTYMGQRLANADFNLPAPELTASTASMFSSTSVAPVKSSPIITAFSFQSSKVKSKTRAETIADSVKLSFRSHFTKYLPQEVQQNPVRPESAEMWSLKAHTSQKRQADDLGEKVNLDDFQPEFVPASKRPKIEVNLKQKNSLFRVPEVREVKKSVHSSNTSRQQQRQEMVVESGDTKQQEVTADNVEKQIKSLRQQMVAKKKKDKLKQAKRKMAKTETSLKTSDSPSSQISMSPRDNYNDITTSDTTSSTFDNQDASSIEAQGSSSVQKSEAPLKKKKKKLSIAEVEENFQAFDYAAAEKELFKKSKEKPKADVFRPSLPSRGGKHKGHRPKLAGPKSNTAHSFPMSKSLHKNKNKK